MRAAARWGLLMVMAVAGFVAFLFVCGEEPQDEPVSNATFFGTKITAVAVLYLCILAGKYFDNKGWLPEIKDPEEED